MAPLQQPDYGFIDSRPLASLGGQRSGRKLEPKTHTWTFPALKAPTVYIQSSVPAVMLGRQEINGSSSICCSISKLHKLLKNQFGNKTYKQQRVP
jgi:hypothetical protein